MTAQRLTPYAMVFAAIADDRFPGIRASLDDGGVDPSHRDAFLLDRTAVSLVHDLEPEDGLGEGVGHLAALVHHAFLHWADGHRTYSLEREDVHRIAGGTVAAQVSGVPLAAYFQLPRQFVWGRLGPEEPYQPLDGCFVAAHTWPDLTVLGVFGLHPERSSLAVVEVEGRYAGSAGGTILAPQMDGAEAAGLLSVNDPGELVLLCGRAMSLVAGTGPEPDVDTSHEIVTP